MNAYLISEPAALHRQVAGASTITGGNLQMRRRRAVLLISIAALAATLLLPVGTAHANPPLRDVEHVDVTFVSHYWSQVCGSTVLRHQVGTFRAALHETGSGSTVEVDTFANWTETLTAPSTGGSFTQKGGPIRTDYPDGVFIGAPARTSFLGLELSVPGLPKDAGRWVADGEVVFIFDNGFPATDYGPYVTVHGHSGQLDDPAAYEAAGRAALGC